jgi:hypothetical protein
MGLEITDPNHALIANFGNFTVPERYIEVRFILPQDFKTGTYTTTTDSSLPTGNKAFADFWIYKEFSSFTTAGQTFTLREDNQAHYIIEFENLIFKTYGGQTATLSGRIIINKSSVDSN